MKHETGGSWTREEDLRPGESDSRMSDDELRGGDMGYGEEMGADMSGTGDGTETESSWGEETVGSETGSETSMEDEGDLEEPRSSADRGSSEADY